MGSKNKKKKDNVQKINIPIEFNNDSQTEDQQLETESHVANDHENLTTKRHFEDEDSETEKKPRKKKKKKQEALGESSDKKDEKSNRLMKKEKHEQRQAEAQAVAKDHLKSQCLTYLSQWKHNRSNWKFMKAKQVWMFKNKFSSYLLPDSSWPLLLEYFESAKGNIRNMLLQDANKVIKQMDEWIESQSKDNSGEENEAENQQDKPDQTTYRRARDLIQCLQE